MNLIQKTCSKLIKLTGIRFISDKKYQSYRSKARTPEPRKQHQKADLLVDYNTSTNKLIEDLITHLNMRGCFIKTIFLDTQQHNLITYKYPDRDYLCLCLDEYNNDGYKVHYNRKSLMAHYDRVTEFQFIKNNVLYKEGNYALDPWIHRNGRIYTHTPNNLLSSISETHINKTQYALSPYLLKANPTTDISLQNSTQAIEGLDTECNFPIDVVYTWVDGDDPQLYNKREKYKKELNLIAGDNNSNERYTNYDELKYSLRSIEAQAKYVRNIYIITDNQSPYWLDTKSDKIHIIDHKEIFTNQDDLPTFNSHAIEANLHNIPDLSENFIYFNDDILLWNRSQWSDYFHANGLSKSFLEDLPNIYGGVTEITPGWRVGAINANGLIYGKYQKKLHKPHLHTPFALKKPVIKSMWQEFNPAHKAVSKSKFRHHTDIAPISFMYHAYSYINQHSTFEKFPEKRFNIGSHDFIEQFNSITNNSSIKSICINDGHTPHTNKNIRHLITALEKRYPKPASWELEL